MEIVSGTACLFVTFTTEAALFWPTVWFPKERVVGVTATAAMPCPVKGTLGGLFLTESIMLRVPFLAPRAAGVKVTAIVQLAPAAKVAGANGHVVVTAKSATVLLILVMVRATLCPLLSVALWGAEDVPRTWLPKAILVGETVTP